MEPETLAVNGNGHHDAIGPTTDLVLGNRHDANGAGVNGNGYHEQDDEPQQPLLSWAEFMADEPVKPERRRSKPQPATLSMFEWTLEQERDAQPASMGR